MIPEKRSVFTAIFPEPSLPALFCFRIRIGSLIRITALAHLVKILFNSILVFMCDERNIQAKTGRDGSVAAASTVGRHRSAADAPPRGDGFSWRHVLLSRGYGSRGRPFRSALASVSW